MSSLIIAVGGTGKSVAAVYLRLAKFFYSKPADVLIVDMLFGNEEIDKLLDKEGIKQRNFMTPWPGGNRALTGVRFAQVIGLDDGTVERPVALTLFAEDELNTLVEKGMNARPIVGATVATRKFWGGAKDDQLSDFRQRIGQYSDVFIVGSVTGGTGSGVMPTLGKWLTEDCRKPPHALLFLPWISIGAGSGDGPSDAAMQANAHAVLSYLKEVDPRMNDWTRGQAPFKDYLLLGLPQQLEAGQSATAAEHPLHLAAATYLLYYGEIMTRNPEVQSGPFYLEVTAGGLRPGDMQPTRGFSLEQAINRQHWYREALLVMAGQRPDEAWDYMVPPLADKWLAWPVLRETVRGLAVRAGGHSARRKVWAEMSKYFVEEAQNVKERLDWFSTILSRDTQHLVYNVSMEDLEKQAGAFLSQALREASKAKVPNLDTNVAWPEAARKAAEQIANDLFGRLEGFASERITKGAATQKSKVGSSTVFLPSGVHNPSGGVNDIERKGFNRDAFDTLIQRYTGSPEAINMPDPQARRFQFGLILGEALDEYLRDPSRPRNKWEENEPLAQFTALLEGVIFGSLHLRLFDLEEFGFRSGFERRILGVLIDSGGNVYGGTDPKTLFFPAPEAWDAVRGLLRRLAAANVTQRDRDEGRLARALLKRFRDTFSPQNRPLWLKMIDEYLHQYGAPDLVDESRLRAGWKQVGPIQLLMPDDRTDVRYLPVYEPEFASGATMALSGDFAPRDGEIHLRVNNSDAGRIAYPQIRRAGVSLREMGAGAISVLAGARQQVVTPGPQINYEQLRQHCNALLGDNAVRASSVEVQSDPFKYPDAVRLPFQQDGLLADYFIQGGGGGRYGRQFLEAVRGRGATTLPVLAAGQKPPLAIREVGTFYFVDTGGAFYVEWYEGQEVKELSLLGQALWHIFIGEATHVPTQKCFVDAGGNVVLEYSGQHLIPGPVVTLNQPDQQRRAAELRCLAWKLTQPNVDPLLKEAAKAWLAFFGLNPSPGDCSRSQFELGDRRWWRP
ncbi:MAG TPA: tubulin-like doman-containing protein [Pyrinomonadaceae bacterium]|nr:tubulin-like doman-containing protein [Pyrinomonadaceae bacterium]